MNIKKFQVSTSDFNAELTPAAPICFVRGNYSDCVLDLMRELIGNGESYTDLERVNDGFYVIHADIESEGKDYGICYIRNAEGSGDNRIGVNFTDGGINFSKADTYEFLDKREDWAMDTSNVLIGTADLTSVTSKSPIFIYDYFDRLDLAIDTSPMLDRLLSVGKQVFIAVCGSYPDEKVKRDGVQVFDVKLSEK